MPLLGHRYSGSVSSYTTIAGPAHAELEIKRSRFLALLQPVSEEAEARAFFEAARSEHPRARHHCTAFVVGRQPHLTQRSNDDGEPSGTAGAPMLEALLAAGLGDVAAVVVRYFGGVLLGAPGLTRAYRSAVAEAVEVATRRRREEREQWLVELQHGEAAALESEARRRGWTWAAEYGTAVVASLGVEPGAAGLLATRTAEITAGRATPRALGRSWVDVPE